MFELSPLFCYDKVMNFTEPVNWINKPCIGFMVNTAFNDESLSLLSPIVEAIKVSLGDAVHVAPASSLHITLLDWIAPLIDYDGADKDLLYEKVSEKYDTALSNAIIGHLPAKVNFTELCVSPSTIYIRGYDNGAFANIRSSFTENVRLPPNTKLPPQIIHSSLARFTKKIDLERVTQLVGMLPVDFVYEVTGFRLIRSTKEPLMEYTLLKHYH